MILLSFGVLYFRRERNDIVYHSTDEAFYEQKSDPYDRPV